MHQGCLFFDHNYPPARGYGYVATNRLKTKTGLYHYGRIRRTDWLPVGPALDTEQLFRGPESDDGEAMADEDAEAREMDENYDDAGGFYVLGQDEEDNGMGDYESLL